MCNRYKYARGETVSSNWCRFRLMSSDLSREIWCQSMCQCKFILGEHTALVSSAWIASYVPLPALILVRSIYWEAFATTAFQTGTIIKRPYHNPPGVFLLSVVKKVCCLLEKCNGTMDLGRSYGLLEIANKFLRLRHALWDLRHTVILRHLD